MRGAKFAVTVAAVAALALTGCSTNEADSLSQQWQDGGDKGYVAGDGSSYSLPASERGEPVEFAGETEHGESFGSTDTIGNVTVVNFWYAGCAPCRAEAPDLEEAYDEFSPEGVQFVGVNTRDQAAQAIQFAEQFGIEYPSILDNPGGRSVQRAFAGQIPLNAVPTTLVLDTEGRVAHRVVGQIAGASQLRTLISETLAETDSDAATTGAETSDAAASDAS
ncbi:TlpA family protein disulfide reductase [Leucobacter denitrificans]|uniref:TlpA family protein disulfide reductase n=1 Tax=Leucobacter denitrificans TaxID=683042 RepID=A0A7G9S204_9MICO|nr:TlpA disulfide reductase family protein [Leucobacter denitrificans]QNN61879.1 TlpA family protein disulfide reductase [Leucobacter denitrificans]